MKQFSKAHQEAFWSANEANFKGDLVSNEVLWLAKSYVGQSTIDVGAGNGALYRAFAKRFGPQKKIIAVDLVPKDPKVQKADCTQLPFEDRCFDTYIATDVLEHLSDDDLGRCLEEANRVLELGGAAIFTTLNKEDLASSSTHCPECGFYFHQWGHCQVFTPDSITRLLEQKGFEVIEMQQLQLGYLASHPWIFRPSFRLRLQHLFRLQSLQRDLFIVARKVRHS